MGAPIPHLSVLNFLWVDIHRNTFITVDFSGEFTFW